MEPQIGYTTTEDGASIAYACMGAGPVVIVAPSIQYFSGTLRLNPGFRELCQAVVERFTLVWYDGRGMGLSARDSNDYGIEARLKDLESVIRAVGADRFALY